MESEQLSFHWMVQLQRSAATTGHSPATSARQTRRARVQLTSVASGGDSTSDVLRMCCCSAHGCRRPRVASAESQRGPVPCRSRCERLVDGPFEPGGAGVAWAMHEHVVCMDTCRTPL